MTTMSDLEISATGISTSSRIAVLPTLVVQETIMLGSQ